MSRASDIEGRFSRAELDQTASIWFLECCRPQICCSFSSNCTRSGQLLEHEVRDWLDENSTVDLAEQDYGQVRLLMTSPASHDGRAKYPEGNFEDVFGGVINKPATDGLGLEDETIQYLSKLLNLPWPLSILTGYSSGIFTKFGHENGAGGLDGEGMVIQTPHSTPIKCLLALFHDIENNLTTCFLHSAFPAHLFHFRDLVPKLLAKSNRPMNVFPVVFLKMYNECIEGYQKIQEGNIVFLEEAIGQTDYYQYKPSSARMPRDMIKTINGISYDLSRFEQFIDFECRLHGFLIDLSNSSRSEFELSRDPNNSRKLAEWLQFIGCVALGHKQAVSSYRQRVQAQNMVLYSMVSQAESRLNYQVAASTKQDSSDMRAVALLTMLFLPGTFIASFFSAGLVATNPGSTPTTNKYLWIYWVITVPLTIIVILIWKCWSRKQAGGTNNLLWSIESSDPRYSPKVSEKRDV